MSSSKLRRNDPSARAWGLARRWLRFGTRSTAELRTYLRSKQVPHALIPIMVQRAGAVGLVDDRACAALWATRLADQGYAREAIRRRLEAKGLAVPLQDDDESRAREVVQRVLSLAGARDPRPGIPRPRAEGRGQTIRGLRLQRRLARLLAQRGFDSDLIDRVLAESFESLSI